MFKVLIVENNRLFAEALYAALKSRFPFLVFETVAGIEEALAKVDSMRPDLFVIDVRLPDGNGLDLTRRIRAAAIDAVVIILTSHDLAEYREVALRSGADHFLGKGSMNMSDIYGIVESILASRFRVLVVAEDGRFKEQMSVFVSSTRPSALVACASDREEALATAGALMPDLVVLCLEASAEQECRFCETLRGLRSGAKTVLVSIGDDHCAGASPADHRVAKQAAFSPEMATIIDSALAARADNSKN